MNAKIKSLSVIACLLLQFCLHAQSIPPVTIHVEKAGNLRHLIPASDKYWITDLTLTGNLNGKDIRFIREMAGRSHDNDVTYGMLSTLNLAGANIVRGGDSYYSGQKTSDNCLGNYMFYNCSKLTSITLPAGITSIGKYALGGCHGLTSITIPGGVTSIGYYAFSRCYRLRGVTIPGGVGNIADGLFYACSGLKSISIPDGVTDIGYCAFNYCYGLTSVTIPSSVGVIGENSFDGCRALSDIYLKSPAPPHLDVYCFNDVNKANCKLHVPRGSSSAYRLAWDFGNVIEDNPTSTIPVAKESAGIRSIPNGIAIEITEKTAISIFNLSGREVYHSVINGNTEIRLNKGAYIVRLDNRSEKIIVN
ncbi:MAG: leucine-rich repeat domain-containing protein [Tannerellaceae bacterium]|jgi:hypothetical protein|nr:leucine-rich repeat domain-containing protein [Tannerellaceae bacterium]